MDLRCDSGKKFGELFREEQVIEFRCRDPKCGHRPGVIVIHEFDSLNGKLLGTSRFREPGKGNGS